MFTMKFNDNLDFQKKRRLGNRNGPESSLKVNKEKNILPDQYLCC